MLALSVVMPVFNGASYVEKAIRCVQKQSIENWELLVVDDASEDETRTIVQDLASKDARIKLFVSATNAGSYNARNIGINNSSGEWIGVVDADDSFSPLRFETLIKYASATGADFAADNQRLIDYYDGLESDQGFFLSSGNDEWQKLTLDTLFKNDGPLTHFNLGLIKPIFRRDFLNSRNLRYAGDQRNHEDFYFYARVIAEGANAIILDKPMYDYTLPVGRSSGRRSPNNRTLSSLDTCINLSRKFINSHGKYLTSSQKELVENREKSLIDHKTFQKLRISRGLYSKIHLMTFIMSRSLYRDAVLMSLLNRRSVARSLR